MIEKFTTIHEDRISALLTETVNDSTVRIDRDLVILAFVNRSGSHLLGEYLNGTGYCAGFGEFLNHDVVERYCRERQIESFPEYLRARATSSRREVFGIKASVDQLVMLNRWNLLAMFRSVKILQIRREDVIAQAVSLWFASRTGQWTSLQKAKAIAIEYDFDSIATIVQDISRQNESFPVIACALNLPLFSIVYENLVADPRLQMRMIGAYLGRDLSDWTPPKETRFQKQESAEKSAMVERAKEDIRRGYLAPCEFPLT